MSFSFFRAGQGAGAGVPGCEERGEGGIREGLKGGEEDEEDEGGGRISPSVRPSAFRSLPVLLPFSS